MKSGVHLYLPLIIALTGTTVGPGCALFRKHHDKSTEPILVDVGGQVHKPQAIEIGSSGLTLHRALVLSGGARDLLMAQNDVAFDDQNDGNLQKLVEQGRLLGKAEVQTEVFQEDPQSGPKVTTKTVEDLVKEVDKLQKSVDEVKAELKRTLKPDLVDLLGRTSASCGGNEERLRVFDLVPGFFVELTREQIQANLDTAKKLEQRLIAELSKTNSRTWQPAVKGELFVALDRPTSDPPVRYYFPYEFVVSGLAGEIELQNRDAVEVVDVQNTELAPLGQFSAAPRDIAIQGAVESPGVASDISSMGDVHRKGRPSLNDSRGVWMLVRPSESGKGQRIFVLPDRMVNVNGAAANAPTMDGDVYTYTILPQVPIVLESLVVRSLRGVRPKRLGQLDIVEKHQQKKAERAMLRQSSPEAARLQRGVSFR